MPHIFIRARDIITKVIAIGNIANTPTRIGDIHTIKTSMARNDKLHNIFDLTFIISPLFSWSIPIRTMALRAHPDIHLAWDPAMPTPDTGEIVDCYVIVH